MTRRPIPPSFVLNTLPKALCNRFGPIATLCLCDPAKVRNPRCPACGKRQTLWRVGTRDARCKVCGEVF